jgi:surface protein
MNNTRDVYIRAQAPFGEWQKPSDWLQLPFVSESDDTFVALHAVFDQVNTGADNFCAFTFTTSAGQYQVDWGDGTVTLHDSNTLAQKQYDYNSFDPTNSTLSSRGYKQVIIRVTAVSGLIRGFNFQQRFVTSPVQNQPYATGFLDVVCSLPNILEGGTPLVFGGLTVRHSFVERFRFLTIGGCTTMNNMFSNCLSLQSVPLFNTQNVISMTNMFISCTTLQSVPLLNTQNVTNIAGMFNNCTTLQSVPLLNTQNVTNMSNMFVGCLSLQSVPLFNTQNVTNMSNMFNSCQSLQYIPAFSTASITPISGSDFGGFVLNCNSLNRCDMTLSRTVSFANCQLSAAEINRIFSNLVDRSATTSAAITISGNWGASGADFSIAQNKNWTVIN